MEIKKVDMILFAWMIIVLTAIIMPSSRIPEAFSSKQTHETAHIIMFGILTFLINRSLTSREIGQRLAAVISLLGASAYAGLLELTQIFVPGRNNSIYNFYIGVLGSVIALIIIYSVRKIQKNMRT